MKKIKLIKLPNIKAILLYGGLICLGYACDKQIEVELLEKEETYELLMSAPSPQANLYMRRHLIDYFQLVALGSEYGSGFPLVKKWRQPMKVYVSGKPDVAVVTELHAIIEELNALFTDGFEIQLANDSLSSNYHIYLGDASTYKKMYPSVAPLLKENRGFFTFYTDADFSITSGHMFVDLTNNSLAHQKHILREELTQSLGLPNDLEYYANSIFYEKWSDVQVYSDMDIEIIRLLYHPQMIPRVDASIVESILRKILGL